MTVPRAQHTATLLNDGRVLLVGGECPSASQSKCDTAELYDPATKQFTRTGALRQGRTRHAATLMPDGRVLITGGHYFGQGVLLVEMYDPRTGQFSAIGSLQVAREIGSATLMEDGGVILGGQNPAEIFNLRSRIPVLLNAQVAEGAIPIVLPNRQILFAGGAFGFLTIYDLKTNAYRGFYTTTYRQGSSNPYDSVAVLLDGTVLVTGGSSTRAFNSAWNAAFLYQVENGEPEMKLKVPNMQDYRNSHTSTTLPDGTVLLYGGNSGGDMTSSNEIFDPTALAFRMEQTAPNRASHTATLLLDGTVLIAGGSVQTDYTGEARGFLDTAVLYTPDKLIAAPRIHTVPGGDGTQGAILHSGSTRLATGDDPAQSGEILEIFAAGFPENGKLTPRVSIGGLAAEVQFFGPAPGYPNLFQVNVRVPSGIASGKAVPVRMNYLERTTNEVTIGIL